MWERIPDRVRPWSKAQVGLASQREWAPSAHKLSTGRRRVAVRQGIETVLKPLIKECWTSVQRIRKTTWSSLLGAGVVALLVIPGSAQLAVPRYQSPIEAPTPQLKLPVPPPVSSPDAAVLEDVIARVNDQIIDRSDLQRKEQQLSQEEEQGHLTPAEYEIQQHDLLRNMIDEQLLLSRGKELDLNVDPEVVREMDDIRKQNHLDSMEALEKAVHDSGISYEDWRADLKNHLIEQTVVRDEVGRTIKRPTPQEEQAYYDAHKQEFSQPEKVRLSEILIPTPENATDAQVAAAKAKAQEVADKLKDGANFADLAKQYSSGQTAAQGGDLGTFERGQLAKVLEDQTFPLKSGQWTQPIRTRQGFVVLEVTGHDPGGVPPLKNVEEQVQEGLYQQEMAPALRKYLTTLREKAYIDIAPGFVDSGASPNEMKPTFVANTPPPVKKKSTVQKARLETGRGPAKTNPAATTATAPESKSGAKVTNVSATTGKKRKKIKREKIRFGQAPENPLPEGTSETLASGADQGPGATSSALPSTTGQNTDQQAAPIDAMTANLDTSNPDPLAPAAAPERKTRFSDRAKEEAVAKKAEKAQKIRAKQLETPTPMTQEEAVTQDVRNSALGLEGDNSKKKKKKRAKGDTKERVQQQPPAPPKPQPQENPIPPRSVRQNGEPVDTAPTSNHTTLPDAGVTPPGGAVNPQPSTPANPAPQPPPFSQPPSPSQPPQ